jgi:hypothetical protein
MIVIALDLETLADTMWSLPVGPHLREEQVGLPVRKTMQ